MTSKQQVSKRLQNAIHYLNLALTSRELDYTVIPYVIAAEHLVKLALATQENNKPASS